MFLPDEAEENDQQCSAVPLTSAEHFSLFSSALLLSSALFPAAALLSETLQNQYTVQYLRYTNLQTKLATSQ